MNSCPVVSLLLLLAPALFGAATATPPTVSGLGREGTEKYAGIVLASELGCAACHKSEQALFAAKPGPDLSAVGSRVQAAHLMKFLAAPSEVKPGTTMPNVLAHLPEQQREAAANSLAHYLASLGKPAAWTPPTSEAVARGGKLYHSVGCVACHVPEKPLPEASPSVPLGPLEEKYTVDSLAAFLERPLDVRTGGRMPDCHLERAEAHDLASYLLRLQISPPPSFQPDAALAAQGKLLFTEHRCQSCHSTGEKAASASAVPALSKVRLDEGCLSDKGGPWPQYPLADTQRTALRTALAAQTKEWPLAEQIEITLTRLNCLACHSRGELGGIVSARNEYFTGREESLGEQGRIPPKLSGVGAKLKSVWLREVIAHGASVRTTLNTRMPKFGVANAEPLASALKTLDTLPVAKFDRVTEKEKPHQIGRELTGTKGLNCIACHAFRGRTAAIRGPELTTMSDRLEENWFQWYLAQPQQFSPLTVMPSFWPDGKSPLPNVLGGDPGRQRDALWQYLAQGPEAGEPAGLVLEPLVVEVKDEAVIIRRAFPGIGKRGLAVGYPGGINLAFDAGQMRLATVWSGGFIEASGLWRGQGSGQAHVLGKAAINFPVGPAFAVLANAESPWPQQDPTPRPSPFSFQGYRLDAQQRPTLLYSLDGFSVEDYFHERADSAGQMYLERRLAILEDAQPGLHLRLATSKSIEPLSDQEFTVDRSLRIRLSVSGTVRSSGDTKELLLPVSRGEWKLEYHPSSRP